jgi:hypothetical protein
MDLVIAKPGGLTADLRGWARIGKAKTFNHKGHEGTQREIGKSRTYHGLTRMTRMTRMEEIG